MKKNCVNTFPFQGKNPGCIHAEIFHDKVHKIPIFLFRVLEGLFALAEELFDVHIKEVGEGILMN